MLPLVERDAAAATRQRGISVGHIVKNFKSTRVLDDINLEVRPGEFVCLLGPSGCGKTTLLRCIAGLERPDAGRIGIGERPVVDVKEGVFVSPDKRRLGMVFQSYALWPHMNVEQHIAYPLSRQSVPRAVQGEMIRQVMRTVGLPDVLERRPSQLSGGQQQRVALARALVHQPPVLLLDEPLSNLDATLRTQLRRELRHLHDRLGTTTVLVTHDQEEASALADTVALMHHGRIIQAGTAADIFDRPRTRFVAEFVGFDNFIRGRVARIAGDRVIITLGPGFEFEIVSDGPPPRTLEVTVAARSDSLALVSRSVGAPGLCGLVRSAAKLGRGFEYEIGAGDQVIVVREIGAGHRARFEAGAEVAIDFRESRSVLVADDNIGA